MKYIKCHQIINDSWWDQLSDIFNLLVWCIVHPIATAGPQAMTAPQMKGTENGVMSTKTRGSPRLPLPLPAATHPAMGPISSEGYMKDTFYYVHDLWWSVDPTMRNLTLNYRANFICFSLLLSALCISKNYHLSAPCSRKTYMCRHEAVTPAKI